jgi:hypothetical protein
VTKNKGVWSRTVTQAPTPKNYSQVLNNQCFSIIEAKWLKSPPTEHESAGAGPLVNSEEPEAYTLKKRHLKDKSYVHKCLLNDSCKDGTSWVCAARKSVHDCSADLFLNMQCLLKESTTICIALQNREDGRDMIHILIAHPSKELTSQMHIQRLDSRLVISSCSIGL